MLIRQYELLIFPNPTITQNIPDLHTYLHAGNLLTVAGLSVLSISTEIRLLYVSVMTRL